MPTQFELLAGAIARSELTGNSLPADIPAGIEAPILPQTVETTGLSFKFLANQVLKTLYVLGFETSPQMSGHLKLSQSLLDKLLATLKQQGHLEILGSIPGTVPILRYGLTSTGRALAVEAFNLSEYLGPAPVTLDAYKAQVAKQSISLERINADDIAVALSHLVISQSVIRQLGPAVNSGRALLLYGPPGNGKTSITEAVGRVFAQHIYIPHCLEVDGQVIKIFDPTVHRPIGDADAQNDSQSVLKRKTDPRWIKCKRPVIVVGGELTLAMLDLDFDTVSKYYEAPVQVKAIGGVFIIDDFGRQLVQPKDLLNRWIVPLEKRIDYLTVHTGKKFDIPFDQLIIFSTNIPPNQLMDAALLRRVKYKIRIDPPTFADYVKIFRGVCHQFELSLPDHILEYLEKDFYPETGVPYAAFHPIFIVEHAIAACRYLGIRPRLSLELVQDALASLYIRDQEKEVR